MTDWAGSQEGPAKLARALVVATAMGVFLGLVGPFGSYFNGPAELRVAYWVGSMWLGVAIFGTALSFARRMADRFAIPRWIAIFFMIVLAMIPQAIISRALAFAMWPELARLNLGLLGWYLQGLAIAGPAGFGYAALRGDLGRKAVATAVMPAAANDATCLFDLLPPRLGRDILCLEMEDHYVRVHTPLGSDLILLPMLRAVDGVGSIEGLRVHRSWWVARAAVVRTAVVGRETRLWLVNGVEVPVSRRMVADVRAAGWIGIG